MASFIFKRPKDALILALVIVLSVFGWMWRRANDRSADLAAQVVGLEADLASKVEIKPGEVIISRRRADGGQERRRTFVPPEGSVTVTTKTGSDQPVVSIKNKGFTFKPGMGLVYSRKALANLDFKFAYFGRYSTTIGFNREFASAGLTRHIDDISGPLRFLNLELGLTYGIDYESAARRMGLLMRSNF